MIRGWHKRILGAVSVILVVAAGVRLAWALLMPVVPQLVTLAVVLVVLGLAIFGRRME
jgi:hypothetical protein